MAVAGAIKVRALGDATEIDTYPTGGLAMSGAAVSVCFYSFMDLTLNPSQVERALTLWATEAFDMESTSRHAKKAPTLKGVANKLTGKVTTSAHAYNERNWGAKTRLFVESARAMRPFRIAKVVELAHKYSKGPTPGSTGITTETNPNDCRNQLLLDLSSSDEDSAVDGAGTESNVEDDGHGKILVFIYYIATNSQPQRRCFDRGQRPTCRKGL